MPFWANRIECLLMQENMRVAEAHPEENDSV
jgi:hypothetical protein